MTWATGRHGSGNSSVKIEHDNCKYIKEEEKSGSRIQVCSEIRATLQSDLGQGWAGHVSCPSFMITSSNLWRIQAGLGNGISRCSHVCWGCGRVEPHTSGAQQDNIALTDSSAQIPSNPNSAGVVTGVFSCRATNGLNTVTQSTTVRG